MGTWLGWLIGTAAVVAAVLLLPWLAQRTMDGAGRGGSGGGGGPFGVLQEIFHPAAHRAEHAVVQLEEREQPAPDGEDDDPTRPTRPTRPPRLR